MKQTMEDEVIFCYECYDRVCPFCGGELGANGRYGISVNKCIDVEKQQYLCKKCNKSLVADPEYIEKYHCYMKETTLQGLNIALIEYLSYEKISEMLELMYGHAPSRGTILNHIEKNEDEFFKKRRKRIRRNGEKSRNKIQWCLQLR